MVSTPNYITANLHHKNQNSPALGEFFDLFKKETCCHVKIIFIAIRSKIMINKSELPACPVETTLKLIGDKWKLLILRDLRSGTKRFGELKKSVMEISQKVLTSNLRDMAENRIYTDSLGRKYESYS